MTSDAILTELRSLPGAPDGLRERVRSLPEPQPRFAWTLPRIDVRRVLLVAAPAVVALGVGAAALHGVLADGSKSPQPVAAEVAQHGNVAGSPKPGQSVFGVHERALGQPFSPQAGALNAPA